jgi:hypothetical protein
LILFKKKKDFGCCEAKDIQIQNKNIEKDITIQTLIAENVKNNQKLIQKDPSVISLKEKIGLKKM